MNAYTQSTTIRCPRTGEEIVSFVDDHDCVHFVPASLLAHYFAFQEEEPATLPPVNPAVNQWEDYCPLTGAYGLFTCDEEGNTTFQAYDESLNYTIESDGHEFHGSTEDFVDFLSSPIGVEPEELVEPVVVPPIPATARCLKVASLFGAPAAAAATPAAAPAAAPVAAPVAATPVIDLSKSVFPTAVQNDFQRPIGAPIGNSLPHYTRDFAEEANGLASLLLDRVNPETLATLETPYGEHWRSPLAKIVGDLVVAHAKRRQTKNVQALFAYSLFHLANSKFVGATAAGKWGMLCELLRTHFTPA